MEAEGRLEAFLGKFTPEICGRAKEAIARLRARFPGATAFVYDNYNALAVGFGPGSRPSEAIFSVAVFPRRGALFFLRGVDLPDPSGLLEGGGNQVRSLTLDTPDRLGDPAVGDLFAAAVARAARAMPESGGTLVIRSVSARQRPRRPAKT
ncbi:MAG TPA: hypothetical protein VGS12_14365 [Caulobacteraceae bacterium]|nr:hypothetical protein [Caulobacteraceae bacterium]